MTFLLYPLTSIPHYDRIKFDVRNDTYYILRLIILSNSIDLFVLYPTKHSRFFCKLQKKLQVFSVTKKIIEKWP